MLQLLSNNIFSIYRERHREEDEKEKLFNGDGVLFSFFNTHIKQIRKVYIHY